MSAPKDAPLDLRAVTELLDAARRDGTLTVIVPTGNLAALLAHCRALRAALAHLRDEIRGQRVHGTLKDESFERRRYWAQVESVADDVLDAVGDAAGAAPEREEP